MLNLSLLLTQITIILIAARVLGWLLERVRQPRVIGEMVAGILLGPSCLGWIAPEASAALFPAGSQSALNALSQIGMLLFMFLVGLELDLDRLRRRGRTAVVVSHASIVVPFALGFALSTYLYPRFGDPRVPFLHFALFVGTAISVTAFPVLARILTDRGLMRTEVGAVAIACAAVDDVTAWAVLAAVVVLVRGDTGALPLWATLVGSLIYCVALVWGVRPLLRRLPSALERYGAGRHGTLAVVLLLVLASAWTTDWLGIHALFGAFLLGAIMPKDGRLAHMLIDNLEGVTLVLLLPLFFAFTGLRTSIGLLAGAAAWGACALVIATAILGKFGGATLAARATGVPWRDAAVLGLLMNTRGLIELVILNIGLEIGVIPPVMFTMMVLMALVTTVMAVPLLEIAYPARASRAGFAVVVSK